MFSDAGVVTLSDGFITVVKFPSQKQIHGINCANDENKPLFPILIPNFTTYDSSNQALQFWRDNCTEEWGPFLSGLYQWFSLYQWRVMWFIYINISINFAKNLFTMLQAQPAFFEQPGKLCIAAFKYILIWVISFTIVFGPCMKA